jgi:hypothetical protein
VYLLCTRLHRASRAEVSPHSSGTCPLGSNRSYFKIFNCKLISIISFNLHYLPSHPSSSLSTPLKPKPVHAVAALMQASLLKAVVLLALAAEDELPVPSGPRKQPLVVQVVLGAVVLQPAIQRVVPPTASLAPVEGLLVRNSRLSGALSLQLSPDPSNKLS